MQAFPNRPLEGDWPFLWLDATYLKLREGGRVLSMAVIVAVAVNTDGGREIPGATVMPSETFTGLTRPRCGHGLHSPFWADLPHDLLRAAVSGACSW